MSFYFVTQTKGIKKSIIVSATNKNEAKKIAKERIEKGQCIMLEKFENYKTKIERLNANGKEQYS